METEFWGVLDTAFPHLRRCCWTWRRARRWAARWRSWRRRASSGLEGTSHGFLSYFFGWGFEPIFGSHIKRCMHSLWGLHRFSGHVFWFCFCKGCSHGMNRGPTSSWLHWPHPGNLPRRRASCELAAGRSRSSARAKMLSQSSEPGNGWLPSDSLQTPSKRRRHSENPPPHGAPATLCCEAS